MTSQTGGTRRGGGLPRAWPLLLVGVVALVIVGVVARQQNPPPAADPAPISAGPSPSSAVPSSSAGPDTGPPTLTAPVTTTLATRLRQTQSTGAGAWEVVGRTGTDVWVIDPASGRVVRTPIPALRSTGPVSLLAGPGWVMVRPLDLVAGYLIRDGSAATVLSGALTGGPALPAPGGDRVWVEATGALDLVDLQGRRTGIAMLFGPPDATGWPTGDGRGGVLLPISDGYRDLYPGSGRTITDLIVAAGPSGVLTADCSDHGQRCRTALVGPTGRAIPTPADWRASWSVQAPGLISPDGSTAAVLVADQENPAAGPRLWLLDLRTGALSAVDLRPPAVIDPDLSGVAAFTPDGRRLVALDDTGAIRVVDVRTGASTVLDPALPAMRQLTTRTEG